MEASIIRIEDIVEVEEIPMEDTYDLTVEGNENYYLATSNTPILVHNSGKSVWIRWWLTEMVKHNEKMGLHWALFTPENRPVAREFAKIMEAATGLWIKQGTEYSMSDDVYQKAARFAEKYFSIISPDRHNFEKWDGRDNDPNKVNTMGNILKYLEYLKKTENIFGYVIDAWNKIEHEQPKWQAETSFISEQLDRLLAFNDYYDLHGIIIAHPKKIEQVGENFRMPSLYDIKGSSAWKEKADIGIVIHRYKMKKLDKKTVEQFGGPDYDGMDEDEKWITIADAPTIVRTEKVRFEEEGVEDRVRMVFKRGGRFVVDKSKRKFDAEKYVKSMRAEEAEEARKDNLRMPATPKPRTSFYEKDDEDDGLPF